MHEKSIRHLLTLNQPCLKPTLPDMVDPQSKPSPSSFASHATSLSTAFLNSVIPMNNYKHNNETIRR